MYKLTLTNSERQAIDWIGERYTNGNDLFDLLLDAKWSHEEWNSQDDIDFQIPESIAWQIAENARQEDGDNEYTFPCFAPELEQKMLAFCMEIV